MMRLLGIWLLSAGLLFAATTATLTGRVTNTAGSTIADVEVRAVNVETGVTFSTQSNEEGLYKIANLPPGVYRVVLQKLGFHTSVKPGVELHVQDIIALNFELQTGSLAESVTEEEGIPLLQAETATLGETIDRKMIAELPSRTRSPHEFVGLSAGAVATLNYLAALPDAGRIAAGGAGFAVNGQRAESVNFLLDGGDSNTNPFTTRPAQILPAEAVREYRVLTNGFTAEYGRNVGFIANLVTQSGTNEFHGSVFDYGRNSGLAANSFENNAFRRPRPVFNRHQFGGSFGGPIARDKAFFFGAFESILVRAFNVQTFSIPSPQLVAISSPAMQAIFRKYPFPKNVSDANISPGLIPPVRPFGGGAPVRVPPATVSLGVPRDNGAGSPQNTHLGIARVDYTLGSQTTLTGRYASHYGNQFAITTQPYKRELDQPILTRNHNATLNATRVWSAAVVSESRLAFSRLFTTSSSRGSYVFIFGGGSCRARHRKLAVQGICIKCIRRSAGFGRTITGSSGRKRFIIGMTSLRHLMSAEPSTVPRHSLTASSARYR